MLATVALTVCWACLGQATLLAWVACIIPPSDWLPLWHRWSAVFVAGTAVGLAGWIAGEFASRLWESLAASTLWLVHDLLKQCAEDVVFVPAQRVIGTATFQVKIEWPCSGFEGMGLMLVLIASFLVISRQVLKFPRALWLLPLGCLLSYLGNVVRIVVLIWLGSHVSQDLALGAFHSRAGLVFFLAEGFILIALVLRSSLFSAVDRQRGTAGWMASEAYVCPLAGSGCDHACHRRVLRWSRSTLPAGSDHDLWLAVVEPEILRGSALDIRPAICRDRRCGLRPVDRSGAKEVRRNRSSGAGGSHRGRALGRGSSLGSSERFS